MVTEGGEGSHSQRSLDGSNSAVSSEATTPGGGSGAGGQQQSQQQLPQHHQYLGSPPSDAVPVMVIDYDGLPLPDGIAVEQLRAFEQLYREHCEVRTAVAVAPDGA